MMRKRFEKIGKCRERHLKKLFCDDNSSSFFKLRQKSILIKFALA